MYLAADAEVLPCANPIECMCAKNAMETRLVRCPQNVAHTLLVRCPLYPLQRHARL